MPPSTSYSQPFDQYDAANQAMLGFDQASPSVPTMDSPLGTPSGQPANVPGGSPYFPMDSLNWGYNPVPVEQTTVATPTTTTAGGGGFDWSQFQPVDSNYGSLSANYAPASGTNAAASTYNATFTPPTGVDYTNDPGYQFRIDQAARAQQQSAFGRLTGLTAGTQKAIGQTTQDAASAEYQNVYNRALQNFQTNAQVRETAAGQQQQANQFNASQGQQLGEFNANLAAGGQQNQVNNLLSLAGLGYNAAGLGVNAAGQYGANLAGLQTGYGNNLATLYTGQGNANAGAAVQQGNIGATIPGALSGIGQAYLAGLPSTTTNPYPLSGITTGFPSSAPSVSIGNFPNPYGSATGIPYTGSLGTFLTGQK